MYSPGGGLEGRGTSRVQRCHPPTPPRRASEATPPSQEASSSSPPTAPHPGPVTPSCILLHQLLWANPGPALWGGASANPTPGLPTPATALPTP